MNHSHATVSRAKPKQLLWATQEIPVALTALPVAPGKRFAPLQPIRHWLDSIAIHDAQMAHTLCHLIPARCPFERTIKLGDRTLFSIPPLCKLNPFYEQVVGLRFRALCYLADDCGEDVSRYC